jgi:DNA polymerase elongation subunit (family B)
MFGEMNESEEFTSNPLKVMFVDIETYSPSAGGFPDVDNPTHPINAITCYDSLTQIYTTFGVGDYVNDADDVVYVRCKSERDLVTKFIEYVENDYPDIISGFNSEVFDIPYIINRCERILPDDVKRLSPLGDISFRMVRNRFGKEYKRYLISGMSCIDYLDIYRKFCPVLRESYKLDNIAYVELGENKVDYGDMSLATLADTDWNTFIKYNIHDVRLLVKLEEALQYISLLRMLAYVGLTTFEGSLGTISMLTGALVIRARKSNEVFSTFVRNSSDGSKNPGAYVSEPKRGFKNGVISFDATSLYPSVMMSLNMSPETKIGSVEKTGDKIVVQHVSGQSLELTPTNFAKFMIKEKCCLSKANILFSQKKRGIVPEFLDYYFNQRVEVKAKMKECDVKIAKAKKDGNDTLVAELEREMERLDTKQLTIKILINSLYGAFGNKSAPFGDDDIASSVTLTGQAIIKQSNEIIREFIKRDIPDISSSELDDVIVYNDTDSCYITLEPYMKREMLVFSTNLKPTEACYEKVSSIEKHLNSTINDWTKKALGTSNSRFSFKREKICEVGLFLQKKRYVTKIIDNEGKQEVKVKYTGVEVNRTSMPATIKPFAKRIIETMLTTQSRADTNKVLEEAYEEFKKLPAQDVSFVMGINNYNENAKKCSGLSIGKGVPIHVKSGYLYNYFLKEFKTGSKYEPIGSGDKIRYFYVQQPNKYGIEVIGYKNDMPKEFEDIFKVDYEKMFEKILFNSIQRFYDNVEWSIYKPSQAVQVDLFDLFS